MYLTLVISIITIIIMISVIIFKPNIKIKNHYFQTFYMITALGALALIAFRLVPINIIIESFTSDSSVNPIKILILFISISLLSIALDELGFFSYLASKALKIAKKNQYSLFFMLYFLIAILTVFTSNDIVILTFTPFICQFAKRANINPVPYLIMEFVTANTYSMLLPIGNPTNIYLTQFFNIDFINYIKVMYLPTLLGGLVSLILIILIFHKDLKKSCTIEEFQIVDLKNKSLVYINLFILATSTILLAVSNYLSLSMWLIALICAIILSVTLIIYSIIYKNFNFIIKPIKRLPYSLIPFLISMFIIVLALDYQGIIKNIAKFIDELSVNKYSTVASYLVSSTLFDNIINNIPMTVFYSSLINSTGQAFLHQSIYATIIGSNIGAYLTPIGALAGIMWMSILKKEDVKFTFISFIKYGVVIVIPVLLASYIGLIITI